MSGPEPESLDPHLGTTQPEIRIHMALFDGLVDFHPRTMEPVPAIAERWEINADSSEFVFHLRRNVRWSNGDPLTAHDFVYALRRALSPDLAARNAYLGSYIRGAQPYRVEDLGVEALDAHTLRFRLTQPAPFFLGLLAHPFFYPVPQSAIEAHGDEWTRPEHVVTNGEFRLESWEPYDRLVVVRDPMYWDADAVGLDRIEFYALDSETTMMNLYRAGDVDAVPNHAVPMTWLDEIRQARDYMDAPENAIEYYLFNTTKPPTDDVRVRRALNAAIDRAALSAYRRITKPLASFTPEGIFPGYPQASGGAFDPGQARQWLAEAGYANAAGAYDPDRFPMTDVELTYNVTENNRQVAEFVQDQWKRHLGFTVPLRGVEWQTYLDRRAGLDYKGLARGGWAGDYLDPYAFLSVFATNDVSNGTGWLDEGYVALLDRANRAPDQAERFRLLAEAEAYLLEAQPVIPLQTPATNWMKKPYVKGMYPNPGTVHPWKHVYIEHDRANWD